MTICCLLIWGVWYNPRSKSNIDTPDRTKLQHSGPFGCWGRYFSSLGRYWYWNWGSEWKWYPQCLLQYWNHQYWWKQFKGIDIPRAIWSCHIFHVCVLRLHLWLGCMWVPQFIFLSSLAWFLNSDLSTHAQKMILYNSKTIATHILILKPLTCLF